MTEKPKEKQKMIITGDDILIEYVGRIVQLMDQILNQYHLKFTEAGERVDKVEILLPQSILTTLNSFIKHKIWSNKLGKNETATLAQLVKVRHQEMVERRFKILKSQMKKSNPEMASEDIQEQLMAQDKTREKIVTRISSTKIEKMVK